MSSLSKLRFARFACVLCSCLSFSLLAIGDDRQGVLYPEEQQLQEAVKNAAQLGTYEASESEATSLTLPRRLGGLDQGPSSLEKVAQKSLAPVTLEDQILSQGLSVELEQFGYDMFTGTASTFAPADSIPVPEDYLIAPGDSFVLQIFGAADLLYTLKVTREGSLLVPEIGDLTVSGLTFGEVKELLQARISSSRIGAKTLLTLDKLHSIRVLIVGEVAQPGTFTVSGLSTALNTLISTGGLLRTGSLRAIEVKRRGEIIAQLDLYDLLLRGDSSNDVFLRDGDVIFIPPIGTTVSVAGEVKRPAIYEIKDEEVVSEIVQMSGGLLPTADKTKVQIERVANFESYGLVEINLQGDSALTPIKNGDVIKVYPVLNRMDGVVLLAGSTLVPGGYQWFEGMKVSDLISGKNDLPQSTDLNIGLIEREDRNKKISKIQYFHLGDAINFSQSPSDISLAPRDKVLLFDVNTSRAEQLAGLVDKIEAQTPEAMLAPIIEIKGFVQHTGRYPLSANTRFLDAISRAGGLSVGVDREYSLLGRVDPFSKDLEFITLRISEALRDKSGDHNPILMPGDTLYLFDSTASRAQALEPAISKLKSQTPYGENSPIAEVSGSVKHSGLYPLTPGMRVSDLIRAAGGMVEEAYGAHATLTRRKLDASEVSSTETLSISLEGKNPLVLGLETILEPYDHLILRQKPKWVSNPKRINLVGEVRFPGTYEVDKNETLCGIVRTAGGFTADAYLFGAVFTRENVRKREQEGLDRINRQLDDLLADVHISPGMNKDTKLPMHQATEDTYRVISQLVPEKATGRMVIDLYRAAVLCEENFDVVLEDGDQLFIPQELNEVSVVGQVYFPTSHQYRDDRDALDYVNLSGGTKELAQREHVYIVQANGEVMSVRSNFSTWGNLLSPKNIKVSPGSTIYVPLSVDRINGREFTESWIDLIYKLSISAASVDFLFGR